jgi:hypothetical protein
MALQDLSTMKPDQLSKLTALQLLRYNSPLPVDDPDERYQHVSYPKMLYGLNEDGTRLVSVRVENETEEIELEGDWRDTPLDWGVVTHPEVPRYQPGIGFDMALSPEQQAAIAAAKASKDAAAK